MDRLEGLPLLDVVSHLSSPTDDASRCNRTCQSSHVSHCTSLSKTARVQFAVCESLRSTRSCPCTARACARENNGTSRWPTASRHGFLRRVPWVHLYKNDRRSLFCAKVCFIHAKCWFFFCNSYCCSLDLFVPDLRSVLIACFKGLFLLWVVSQLFTKSAPLESECLEERIEILPMTETEEEVTGVTVENVAWPWRRFIREMVDRDDALPEISFVMMLVCWMMWRLCCVWWCIFMMTRVGTTHGCSSGQLMRTPESSSLLTVISMRRDLRIIQGCECPHR